MITKVIPINENLNKNTLEEIGECLRRGGLVVMPTETVYGLAANAYDDDAVSNIFKVKGRPQDNPLIVHIADLDELERLCCDIPQSAYKLAKMYWPGPLTMVLKSKNILSKSISAGLDTVAVRMPSNEVARAIIKASKVPIAAPSANISGRPSPTEVIHCINDLNEKVDYIVDGGRCNVGVESTVVDLSGATPCLLRPGGITYEQLTEVLGKVDISSAVTGSLMNSPVRSPGMKYRHYAPNTKVVIIRGDKDKAAEYVLKQSEKQSVGVLCFDEEKVFFHNAKVITYGRMDDPQQLAQNLFSKLRQVDGLNVDIVFARCPEGDGIYRAVENRLKKAAGFNIIDV